MKFNTNQKEVKHQQEYNKSSNLITEVSFEEDTLQAQNEKDRPAKYGACDQRRRNTKGSLEAQTSQDSDNGDLENCKNNKGQAKSSKSEMVKDGGDQDSSVDDKLTKLERLALRIPCLGIFLALGASFFLGSAGMLVKMTTSVHGIQVAVFRAMIQLIVYSGIMHLRKLPLLPDRGERWPVMGRAALGSASITFSYYALKLIPLGDATTIRFSLPIWTLIISYLILNESCDFFKIFAVIISISGVVLIAKPDDVVHAINYIMYEFGWINDASWSSSSSALNSTIEQKFIANQTSSTTTHLESAIGTEQIYFAGEDVLVEPVKADNNQLIGCILALSSSICLSMSIIALRLCKETPAEITIWWLSFLSIVIGSITLLSMGEWRLPNNWLDVLYIGLNGLCGTLGQWFITSALKVEQSGVISLARTCDIQVAFLYSAFLLHEEIRATSIVGSVMVSGGVICCVIPKWLESREKSKKAKAKKREAKQGQQQ